MLKLMIMKCMSRSNVATAMFCIFRVVLHDINVLRPCDFHRAPLVRENPRSTGPCLTGVFNVGCIFQFVRELSSGKYRTRAFVSLNL